MKDLSNSRPKLTCPNCDELVFNSSCKCLRCGFVWDEDENRLAAQERERDLRWSGSRNRGLASGEASSWTRSLKAPVWMFWAAPLCGAVYILVFVMPLPLLLEPNRRLWSCHLLVSMMIATWATIDVDARDPENANKPIRMNPGAWFFGHLALWPVVLPVYMLKQYWLSHRNHAFLCAACCAGYAFAAGAELRTIHDMEQLDSWAWFLRSVQSQRK